MNIFFFDYIKIYSYIFETSIFWLNINIFSLDDESLQNKNIFLTEHKYIKVSYSATINCHSSRDRLYTRIFLFERWELENNSI